MEVKENLPEKVKNNLKKITNNEIDIICKYKLTKNIENIRKKLSSKSKNLIKLFTFTKRYKINGFAILKINKTYTELLYLCSNKKGNGSKLLKKVEEITIKEGIKRIVLESHEDAIGFYKKKGYESIDRRAKSSMFKVLIKGKGDLKKIKKLI